jgi:iron complex transport system substrate-binding protein
MRIASLVPSSTEMLFALGLGDHVVAVTHECDWPPEAASLPHLTRSIIPDGLSSAAIDRVVRETVASGQPLYELDRDRLAELDPELIVTQAVCEVCAVSFDDVAAVAATLPSTPSVISLDPLTFDDVLDDVLRLGEATGASERAEALRGRAKREIDEIGEKVATVEKPGVLALEWLDPAFVAGHWVPEMIDLAGGRDLFGHGGERSRTASWDELRGSWCDVVVVMPCGYGVEGSVEEARLHEESLALLSAGRFVAVDASAYFSRPGPRLVEGVRLLASLLHPELFPTPPRDMSRELEIRAPMRAEGLEPPQA